MSEITLYVDVISPYSYFAFTQRQRLRDAGHTLTIRPAAIRAIMAATGNVPTSVTCAAKMAYQRQDLRRWAERLSLPLRAHPDFGKFSTVPLLQAILAAEDQSETMMEAAFQAVWFEQANVTSDSAMRAFFDQRVEGGGKAWDMREDFAAALDDSTAACIEAGGFGLPLFVAETGLYFGNDRIDFLLEDLAAQAA